MAYTFFYKKLGCIKVALDCSESYVLDFLDPGKLISLCTFTIRIFTPSGDLFHLICIYSLF